jgi:hypothetical protein
VVIVIELHFSINGTGYIIHRGENGHKEIIYEHNRQRVENEKTVCRDYGIEVSPNADIMNTHKAIKLLIKNLVQVLLRD